jgi:hypothetical protein
MRNNVKEALPAQPDNVAAEHHDAIRSRGTDLLPRWFVKAT